MHHGRVRATAERDVALVVLQPLAEVLADGELPPGDPVPDGLLLRVCRGVKRRYVAPSTAATVRARFSIVTWPSPISSTAATSRSLLDPFHHRVRGSAPRG